MTTKREAVDELTVLRLMCSTAKPDNEQIIRAVEKALDYIENIDRIVKKHRAVQQELLDGIKEFKRLGMLFKVEQMGGWIQGLGEVCSDLENIEGV